MRTQRLKTVDGKVSYRVDKQQDYFRALVDIGLGGVNPANADVYEPRALQLVPKDGAWAMITRQLPPMEGALDEYVRVGRIFYVEHMANADEEGFPPNGRYKVVCKTTWGTVHLWPYEYTVMAPAHITDLWQHGMVFHPEHVELARFSAVTFYARSRGIGLADAAVMALGSFTGSVGWFEPPPEVASDLEAMAQRINQWPWDRTKRDAARKAR